MKRWQFFVLLAAMLLVLLAILAAFPATNHLVRGVIKILAWCWMIIAGILVATLIAAFGGILGFLTKALLVAALDTKLEQRQQITNGMHWGIAIMGGLICGVLFALFMPVLMGWETWVRWFAIEFGWSGVYETPPTGWGIYSLITFVLVYLNAPYLIGPERKNDDDRWSR